jgi:uncharacterized protein YndB with AHSA1/START domain
VSVIRLQVELPLSCDDTWEILTGASHITSWWGNHVSLEARPGGAFVEHWSDGNRALVTRGTVTCCEPPNRLTLTWEDDGWAHETSLNLAIKPVPGGSTLVLLHQGWDQFPPDQRQQLRQAHESGWRHHLDNFRDYAAGR